MKHALLLAARYRPRACDGITLDGSGDYVTGSGLAAITSSKSGICSLWAMFTGGGGVTKSLFSVGANSAGGSFAIIRSPGGVIIPGGSNSASASILQHSSNAVYGNTGWLHILYAYDLATAGSARYYINDVEQTTTPTTYTNDTVDLEDGASRLSIGNSNGANILVGSVAEVWFQPGAYLDFDVEANRRKFITSSRTPANLGSDGSAPLSSAPEVYFALDKGEALNNIAVNRGTKGDMTVTGTLVRSATMPGY